MLDARNNNSALSHRRHVLLTFVLFYCLGAKRSDTEAEVEVAQADAEYAALHD